MTDQILSFTGEYRFLSNFYPSKFIWKDREYISNEHFFQAMKAATDEEHEYVRASSNPSEAKRRGRQVTLCEDWEKNKVDVMTLGLVLKFNQNPELRQKLLDTGDAYLEEGNTWGDTFWGKVGLQGMNMLGRLLMDLRTAIRDAEADSEDPEFDRGFNEYHNLQEGPH